jgi:hypothetical protein
MKKITQTCVCLALGWILILPISAQGQGDDSRFGIKAGVNLSNFYKESLGDQNLRLGFNVGIFTELAVSESFSIQPELLFTTKGNQISYDEGDNLFQDLVEGDPQAFTGDVETNLSYIELPLLAKFTISEVLNLHVGPYLSYLLDASTQVDGTLEDRLGELDRKGFNTWDYGVVAGIAADLNLVTIGFRYDLGLRGITEDAVWEGLINDRKNQALQFYVGVGL